MKTILIATVRKTNKFGEKRTCYANSYPSFDRDALIKFLEDRYGITLTKDEEDNFPYFTDGGFKFKAENTDWSFDIECHPIEIIE